MQVGGNVFFDKIVYSVAAVKMCDNFRASPSRSNQRRMVLGYVCTVSRRSAAIVLNLCQEDGFRSPNGIRILQGSVSFVRKNVVPVAIKKKSSAL